MVDPQPFALKKPVLISGIVVKGQDRSLQDTGVRTANLDRVNAEKGALMLKDELMRTKHGGVTDFTEEVTGVYYGVGKVNSSKLYPAVINLRSGPPGSVIGRFDAHLIDFPAHTTGSLYDQPIRCAIVGKLRDQKVFDTPEALRRAVANDIERTRGLITQRMLDEMGIIDFFK